MACKTCKYWEKTENIVMGPVGYGTCKRYPPIKGTEGDDWCGEYQAKQDESFRRSVGGRLIDDPPPSPRILGPEEIIQQWDIVMWGNTPKPLVIGEKDAWGIGLHAKTIGTITGSFVLRRK